MKFDGCWENYKNDDISLGVSTSRMRTLMHTVTYKTLRSICSPNKANKRQRMIVEAKSSSGGSSDPVPHLACKLDFRGHGEVPATALDLIPDRKWRVLHLGKLRMLGFSEWVPAPLFDDRSIADTSNKSCAPSADTKATALANPSIDRNAVSAVTVHPGSHSSKVSQRIRAIQGDWVHSGGGLVKVKPVGDALKITNPYFRLLGATEWKTSSRATWLSLTKATRASWMRVKSLGAMVLSGRERDLAGKSSWYASFFGPWNQLLTILESWTAAKFQPSKCESQRMQSKEKIW